MNGQIAIIARHDATKAASNLVILYVICAYIHFLSVLQVRDFYVHVLRFVVFVKVPARIG